MADPIMRDVLAKLRRFQAFSKEQGFPKVNLEELVPPHGLDIRALDSRQHAALREMLDAQTAAAAAAGCHTEEAAAKAAADAASAERRRAAHAAQDVQEAVQPGRLDPTQRPETLWQGVQVSIVCALPMAPKYVCTQLYWQDLGDLTWRNPEYKKLFIQKCIASVLMLIVGLGAGYIGRHYLGDLGSRVVRWGPGTFSPAGILQGADPSVLQARRGAAPPDEL